MSGSVAVPEDQLSLTDRASLERLAGALVKGECVLFIGAGASKDPAQPDFPDGAKLSKELAAKCELEWYDTIPLTTTAFFYESFFSRQGLNEHLQWRLNGEGLKPSSTITSMVELVTLLEKRNRPVFVMTTNFDRMFEVAYEARMGHEPHVIKYRGAEDPNKVEIKLHAGYEIDDPEYWHPLEQGTYLYKMHGCISDAKDDENRIVVTEEDYVNFLGNALSDHPNKKLLNEARGQFALRTMLFVGYSLMDWNFRVIFKATAERSRQRTHYAVQYFVPSDDAKKAKLEQERWQKTREFWGRKKVEIINHDASGFMQHLITQVRNLIG